MGILAPMAGADQTAAASAREGERSAPTPPRGGRSDSSPAGPAFSRDSYILGFVTSRMRGRAFDARMAVLAGRMDAAAAILSELDSDAWLEAAVSAARASLRGER